MLIPVHNTAVSPRLLMFALKIVSSFPDLKFIAALAASERACVEAGALSAGCHLFVAGIKVKSTLGTREVDLKDMVSPAWTAEHRARPVWYGWGSGGPIVEEWLR